MKNSILGLLATLLAITACTGNKAQKAGQTTDTASVYQEQHRPQIHFSPASGWMNDPNGMVYYAGEYHLFYQHNPAASVWGPMHWGHAVSKDLVHWEHLPIALEPDSLGYIFSGSAVVDHENTSGFGTKENPPLVAFFTYHDMKMDEAGQIGSESQAIAYSTDKGRTWTKYAGNPVIKNPGIRDFRDPKVIWHTPTHQWVASVAAGKEIQFFTSPDCMNWTATGRFSKGNPTGTWECPDLFPLKVNGSDEEKWVLTVNVGSGGPFGGSAAQYFVGDFDGKTFTTTQDKELWMDYGFDNYASVTWSDAPNGRRISIGWMTNLLYSNNQPTDVWRGSATFPRELGLDKVMDLYLLTAAPVKEVDLLKGETAQTGRLEVDGKFSLTDKYPFAQAPLELKLTFDQANNTQMSFPPRYGVTLKNKQGEYLSIGYDNLGKFFYVDRTNATGKIFSDKFACTQAIPYIVNTSDIEWTLLIDVASVEFFTAGGRVVISDVFYPSEPFDTIELFSENGVITVNEGSVSALHSIWKKQ